MKIILRFPRLARHDTLPLGHIAIVPLMLLCLLLLPACSVQNSEIKANLGEQFSLAVGQSATVAGQDLKIQFVKVIADSRCPSGATCVWQGEVRCLVEMTYLGSLSSETLTQLGLTNQPSQIDFQDYRITFDVEPYPALGKQIKPDDYRLRFTVERLSS